MNNAKDTHHCYFTLCIQVLHANHDSQRERPPDTTLGIESLVSSNNSLSCPLPRVVKTEIVTSLLGKSVGPIKARVIEIA